MKLISNSTYFLSAFIGDATAVEVEKAEARFVEYLRKEPRPSVWRAMLTAAEVCLFERAAGESFHG